MKKFLSFLLTFVMLFSLTMPAMAAEVEGGTEGNVTASYDPTITITGVAIGEHANEPGTVAVDETNKTYTVTFPEDQTLVDVNIIVSGQNLDKIPGDCYVTFGALTLGIKADDYDTNTGNAIVSSRLEVSDIGTHDLKYTTDGSTYIDTGWDVVVKQAEPAPTEVSLNVKLNAIDSTEATITDAVSAILSGSAVDNRSIAEYGLIYTGDQTMTWNSIPTGYKTPADISLTVTDTNGDGVGELTSNSSHATVELVDGVYIITVKLEKDETTTPDTTPAEITGATVYVNDVEQPVGNIIITAGDTVKVVFTGEHFDKLTDDYMYDAAGLNGILSYFVTDSSNTATVSCDISELIYCNESAITYTNAGESATETGYTLTYLEKGTQLTTIYFKNTASWAKPCVNFRDSKDRIVDAVELKLVGGESDIYSAAVPVSNWVYQVEFYDLETNTYAEMQIIPAVGDQYNYGDNTWTEFKATEHTTTSANIVWGSMAFTYTDGENGAEGAWSNDGSDGAGTVTVTNTGTTTFTATAEYKPEDAYAEINGYFAENFATASAEIDSGNSYTFTLELNGEPNKAITAGTKIGSVTISINEAAEG